MASVVGTFVSRQRQDRYLELLKSARGRAKVRKKLAHFDDFDPRFVVGIPISKQTAALIEQLLVSLGAPRRCSVFSELEERDSSDITLREALDAVVGGGVGAVILCGPGLAFYESEEPGNRFLLRSVGYTDLPR